MVVRDVRRLAERTPFVIQTANTIDAVLFCFTVLILICLSSPLNCQGLIINGSATVVRNLHIYVEGNLRTGVEILAGVSDIRLDSCYFDGCPVISTVPTNLQVGCGQRSETH